MIAKPISIKLTGGKSGGCASKAVELTYRRLKGALCRNRPVRSDYLDKFVWDQIVCLLEDGTLMQAEIDRRKETARNTDPRRQRNEALRNEQARLGKNVERLVTAYQEGLLNLEQLRQRMPELNQKSQAVESELRSLEMAAMDQTRYLQLAESLEGFRTKLRVRAKTLEVRERQQILRLLVKEILVDANSLTIRHSIPISQTQKSPATSGSPTTQTLPSAAPQPPSYLLRPRSHEADPLQLAMTGINPVTAYLLPNRYVSLMPGDWIGQTAANAAMGSTSLHSRSSACRVRLSRATSVHRWVNHRTAI